MCAICGVMRFDGSPPDPLTVESMSKLLKHRGPDDKGVFAEQKVALGHRRLSIIDLTSAGRQPMLSSCGRFVLVYNGEIYNYLELRQELAGRHEFRTETDSEVLLCAYQRWGEACLDRLNGMFAFAIYDREQQSLFVARDRFGIKPLYFYVDDAQFIFASEPLAVLSALGRGAEINDQAVFDYLVFNRTDQTEQTFFKTISRLQHGCCATVSEDGFAPRHWYRLAATGAESFRSSEEYFDALRDSIGLRLRSDVPIGVCLSGGLDSSSIVTVLAGEFDRSDVCTFSAIYGDGKRGDEAPFIREYAHKLPNMTYVEPTHESLARDVGDFIRAHGEPVPTTSPYAQFKVMEAASQKVKVTLDGQGADEQLAGYHYFFGILFKQLLRQGRVAQLSREISAYSRTHRSLYGLMSSVYFLLPEKARTRAKIRERGYVDRAFAAAWAPTSEVATRLHGSSSIGQSLLDHFEHKLEHLLKWEDRNSMWFSVEARVPFLDHRLVERCVRLPSDQIIAGGQTKLILRNAMSGRLPEKIRTRRDKVGFETPEAEWFREPGWRDLVADLLSSQRFRERGYIDPVRAKSIHRRHLSNQRNASREIWKWINLELWMREFVDDH